MDNKNNWRIINKNEDYIDIERELIDFKDEGNSSVDMVLTFDKQAKSAYISLQRRNDDGNTRDLADSIPMSLKAAIKYLGDASELMPSEFLSSDPAVSDFLRARYSVAAMVKTREGVAQVSDKHDSGVEVSFDPMAASVEFDSYMSRIKDAVEAKNSYPFHFGVTIAMVDGNYIAAIDDNLFAGSLLANGRPDVSINSLVDPSITAWDEHWKSALDHWFESPVFYKMS